MSLLKALVLVSGRIAELPAGDTVADFTTIANKPTTLAGYGIAASDVLATLITVDGSGSGLDADTLDGANIGTSGATIGLNNADIVHSGSFQVTGSYLALTRTGANNASFFIDRAAGNISHIDVRTGSSLRWRWAFATATAESGSNAGSDFLLQRYSDTAVFLSNVISIPRSTGIVDFTSTPTVGGSALMLASAYTAADVLSKMLTVDGAGSGLDADLLDGLSSAAFGQLAANNIWTGTHDFRQSASGGVAVWNFNNSAAVAGVINEARIDLSPGGSLAGARSGFISAINDVGANTQRLAFGTTANTGNPPIERMFLRTGLVVGAALVDQGANSVNAGAYWVSNNRFPNYQVDATNANVTVTCVAPITTWNSTGTLTANRTLTIATTNAVAGWLIHLKRNGADTGGPWQFTINGVFALTLANSASYVYSGAAWIQIK